MEENKKIEYIKKSFEFKNIKKYKEAIEQLYKALEFDGNSTDNIEIFCQIGDLYVLLGNYEKSLDEYSNALAFNRNDYNVLLKIFDTYFLMKNYTKALEIAKQLCEIKKQALSYNCYIKTLIALDEIQKAIETFNSLDEEIKLNADLLYLISTFSGNKRKIVLEKVVSLDEFHQNANIDLAEIEFKEGNYSKTINYCLNVDEDSPMALYYLAMVENKKRNYIKAIELFLKAIEFDKNEHDFYYDLAKTYIDIGWLNEALYALKKTINYSLIYEKNENLDEKYFLTAWILIKQNKHILALNNLHSIKSSSKLYPKAQILEQTINLKNTDLSTAKNVLEKYVEKEGNNTLLLDTLANVYKELKLYNKAIEVYQQAQRLYPGSIYYTLEIIDLYIDDKNYEQALKLIEEFKQSYSNCVNIYNSLTRIYYRWKQYDKALENINKYLELDKNNAEAFYFKGLILNDLSKFEEAKTQIYCAIKLDPTKAKYYNQMARSYYELNEYDNAMLYIKEAIEINDSEINYKKLAYDISLKIGNSSQIEFYEKQLKRYEAILKMNR